MDTFGFKPEIPITQAIVAKSEYRQTSHSRRSFLYSKPTCQQKLYFKSLQKNVNSPSPKINWYFALELLA